MSIENHKNRDLFLKICFIYFLNHILKVLEINEEIEDIIPVEYIGFENTDKFKILNHLLDFVVLTKSGKIIIFEFKKNTLRKKDLKQLYDYYKQVFCKEKTDVIAIIIVISKYGKIEEYREFDITYHPRIIKTKSINKQKNLKLIRDKFNGNARLTSTECSLLISFPIFDLEESETEIVEEMCRNIEDKQNCIPAEELEGVTMGMYLNILEYIEKDKQHDLMEMIGVDIKSKGVIARMKKEEWDNGLIQGEKNIILELLKNQSIASVSKMIGKKESEILELIK